MPSIFNKLPMELRLKIWAPLVSGTFDGEMPNIIKALRTEDKLYQEALEIFYKTNTYSLHAKNRLGFLGMPIPLIHMITKVKIVIDKNVSPLPNVDWDSYPTASEMWNYQICLKDLAVSASLAVKVREVDIEINPGERDQSYYWGRSIDNDRLTVEEGLYEWGKRDYFTLLAGFRNLKKVSVVFPTNPFYVDLNAGTYLIVHEEFHYHFHRIWDSQLGWISEPHPVERGNKALGALAKLDHVTSNFVGKVEKMHDPYVTGDLNNRDRYIWVAEDGQFLTQQMVTSSNAYGTWSD